MDAVYSLTLLFAVAIGGLGTLLFLRVVTLASSSRQSGNGLASVALVCGLAAMLCGMLSASVHLVFGHGSDALEPMSMMRFFSHHKAYWLVLALALPSLSARLIAPRGTQDQ